MLAEDSITIAEDNYSKRIFRITQASLGWVVRGWQYARCFLNCDFLLTAISVLGSSAGLSFVLGCSFGIASFS
jgi:hypothetical protein